MPMHAAATRHHREERQHDARQRDRELEFAGDAAEVARVGGHERPGEHDAGDDDSARDEQQRGDQVVGQMPRVVFAVQREAPREGRHERRAHGPFGEEIPDEIGNAERDDERVHVAAGAEERRQHLIAGESEDAAGQGGGAGDAGRPRKQRRPRQAPSLRRTSSLTVLPSTFCPVSFDMAAFMTRPMSLADVAPVSAIASATA